MTTRTWDVLVAGAGPAGSLAARELARSGIEVLLVDKAQWPRGKVCGCCLNGAALGVLESVGLGDLPSRQGAVPLAQMELYAGTRRATLALPAGAALSRRALDAALVEAAVEAGVSFLPETVATLEPEEERSKCLSITLSRGPRRWVARARVALAADGLGGQFLRRRPEFRPVVARDARLGAGTVIESPQDDFGRGKIFMACGCRGYAGLVRLEDGRLNIAAAIDLAALREEGRAPAAVTRILKEAGLRPPRELFEGTWRGTPALTRRVPRVAGPRLFVLGDAAGYVEPFTGEGIAWAMLAAAGVAPLAAEAVRAWDPSLARRWTERYRRTIARRQWVCRGVSRLLRHRAAVRLAAGLLASVPRLASPLTAWVNASPDCCLLPAASTGNGVTP